MSIIASSFKGIPEAVRILTCLIALWLVEAAMAADVFLESRRTQAEKIPLMLLPLSGAPEDAAQITLAGRTLRADLIRSQLFHLIDPPLRSSSALEAPDAARMTGAARAGAQALVSVVLQREGDTMQLSGNAYETGKGTQVVGVQIGAKSARSVAHRFSDKLVAHFTGEVGIAQTRIAYISDLSGKKEIYLMDYDGEGEIRISSDRSIVLSPRWSHDAKQVAYTSYRSGNPDVYLLDILRGQRKTLLSYPGSNFPPAWSPNGDWVVFSTTRDGNAEIYTMHPNATGLMRLTFNEANDLSPTWSPDGKQVAFTSDRGGGPQVYVMSADGGNVRRLTFSGKYNTSPSWSPIGDRIAYACRDEQRRLKICVTRLDGDETTQITENGDWDDESPSWSPNGREIIFASSRAGKSHLFAISADGSHLVRLTSNGANHTSPSWSPR
jgi:TolB protein